MKSAEDPLATAMGELGARFGLGRTQEQQLLALLGALTSDSAPTAVREPRQALRAHIADSLTAIELAATRSSRSVLDIGAGAGLPGLPLAIALPHSEVWLLESQHRKCAFLEGACQAAGIGNAHVVCVRAEEWAAGMGSSDLALARALAPQPVVLEYAAPLLREGGTLIDWRGRRNPEEEEASTTAAAELGLRLQAIHWANPYEEARDHHLHEFLKIAPTPSRFPRRAGVARKRPLGC
ncbi:MAG TPA: 16S rRNA (guanine(527)-N(7))-methyltransferase RsmG [Solirubrobacteraceae bacterium]